MAPITTSSNEENHQALLDKLDQYGIPKKFRNPHWRVAQRRNKNVKQILSEASRREAASLLATQNNSGSSTPLVPASESGAQLPSGTQTPVGIVHASNVTQRLNRLVLEKNQHAYAQQQQALSVPGVENTGSTVGQSMAVTYTNIESAPSMNIASKRHYCDITGLSAPYRDPKTRLRYHNMEIFAVIRTLGQGSTEGYLAARGAHTVLK